MTALHVLIVGAGPAGLTAALELLQAEAPPRVTVVEADAQVGGISKTVVYKGNRMDIGGHRFFSKSDWVTRWWLSVLPPAETNPHVSNGRVMLTRNRLSRIYFESKFFPYPLRGDWTTARTLGVARLGRILVSYARARLRPRRPETSLEDFLINRFGTELYRLFFEDYTEKVWGVPCRALSPEWGAQRIKGLSVSRAIRHMLLAPVRRLTGRAARETSLIERFLYPRLGPGQMWETVAERVRDQGGSVLMKTRVVGLHHDGAAVNAVVTRDADGTETRHAVDAVISSMPVSDLIGALDPPAPDPVREVAQGLAYRDFLTVGILADRMAPRSLPKGDTQARVLPDTWIYVQDPRFRVGRLQIFNNWSPDLVADPDTAWIGMEYFCAEGDDLWTMPDDGLIRFAADEIVAMGLVLREHVRDGHAVRVPKAYPGYFGTYGRFAEIRTFTDSLRNLYLVGRNGMHRYNNQDHSMLTAALAAKAILNGSDNKEDIWAINIDDSYHEEK